MNKQDIARLLQGEERVSMYACIYRLYALRMENLSIGTHESAYFHNRNSCIKRLYGYGMHFLVYQVHRCRERFGLFPCI